MTPPPANACLPSLSTITCIPSRRHPILMSMSFAIYTLIVVSLPYYVAPCGTRRPSVLERQTPPKRPEEKPRPKVENERTDPTEDDAQNTTLSFPRPNQLQHSLSLHAALSPLIPSSPDDQPKNAVYLVLMDGRERKAQEKNYRRHVYNDAG